MRAWHRLELVLDVMTRRGFQGLQLALVGEGPALEPLLAEAERRGLSDRIRACGAVPASAVPAHVLAFDGALIPAINDYASPLKLFDSLCAGVVTLAPDQPNLRELVRDGSDGLLFEPGSADALARQLGRVVEDRALATRLGEAGCRRLQDEGWTWDGSAARVLEVYESLQRRGR
jgi:glycosyltransferase involved in cell wall biosynthesis